MRPAGWCFAVRLAEGGAGRYNGAALDRDPMNPAGFPPARR